MEIIATGKNVEIAIQNGLLECGLTRDEVEVKVLDAGGMFKKAKVMLTEKSTEPSVEEKVEETASLNSSSSTPVAEESVEENKDEDEEVEETGAQNEQKKEKKVRVIDSTALQSRCQDFLRGLVDFVDKEATISCEAKKNELYFTVAGTEKGLSKLIGFHGDNLKAIQMLLSGLKRRHERPIRIFLDVNGYKADRNQALIDLANKTAEQAINIERNIHLDPMNAYDRRIIHTTLQGRDDVTTESTGEGEKRHVVVKPIFRK